MRAPASVLSFVLANLATAATAASCPSTAAELSRFLKATGKRSAEPYTRHPLPTQRGASELTFDWNVDGITESGFPVARLTSFHRTATSPAYALEARFQQRNPDIKPFLAEFKAMQTGGRAIICGAMGCTISKGEAAIRPGEMTRATLGTSSTQFGLGKPNLVVIRCDYQQ